jgi:hypothetical protein
MEAPKFSKTEILDPVKATQYYRFPDTTVTICCLTLTNGYTVTGESACVSIENFDSKIGEDIAYNNAVEKIWTLEGYMLKQRLFCFGK